MKNLWVVDKTISWRLSEKSPGHRFIDDPEVFLSLLGVSIEADVQEDSVSQQAEIHGIRKTY